MATFANFIAQLLFFGLLYWILYNLWLRRQATAMTAATGFTATAVKTLTGVGAFTVYAAGMSALGWLTDLPWLDILRMVCQLLGGCA